MNYQIVLIEFRLIRSALYLLGSERRQLLHSFRVLALAIYIYKDVLSSISVSSFPGYAAAVVFGLCFSSVDDAVDVFLFLPVNVLRQ